MSRLIFSLLDRSSYGTLYPALNAAGLPTGDLDEPERRFFELADGDSPIGFVGLEGDGPDLLLRSLIVFPGRKRQGNGGLLVAHAEAVARRDGARRLHLLTTTAGDFFRARGYRDEDRAAAPMTIIISAQFAALCPGSASYLVKDLA